MTTKVQAICNIIFFVLMLCIFSVPRKKILDLLYGYSGRTEDEIKNMKHNIRGLSATARSWQSDFKYWLKEKSTNRKKLQLLIYIYRTITLIVELFASFSIIGLATNIFNKIIFIGYVFVPLVIALSFFISKIFSQY